MSKFRIIAKQKTNGEIIEGEITFKYLEKLDLDNLDLVIKIIYGTLVNKENNIDLHGLDIFYVHQCEREMLLLSVANVWVLETIYRALDYRSTSNNENYDEKFKKKRLDYFSDIENRLEKNELSLNMPIKFEEINE